METQSTIGVLGKRNMGWSRKVTMMLLAFLLAFGQWMVSPSEAQAAGAPTGATYFQDDDNWGGGSASTTADGDMNIGIKNDKLLADNAKYPVEFKIVGVTQLPTTSAQLLIRANDVDEYNVKTTDPANGEWDRVYFSSNPADIKLGSSYTPWPTGGKWDTNLHNKNFASDYKKEISNSVYLGALSGQDSNWNTTVLSFKPEEFNRINLGDNYVGVTIHHYYQDTRSGYEYAGYTGWQMIVDWGQLVIDGGVRNTGEITQAGLKVENGQVTIDSSFLPKVPNQNYSMEINVIERTLVNGQVVERNLGLDKEFFGKPTADEEKEGKTVVIKDSGIDPSKEYVVNIILFDDRGNGPADSAGMTPTDKKAFEEKEKFTNPGFAEHVVTISTLDPIATDISKSALRADPTNFTADDFKDKYLKINGNAPNGDQLQTVKIVTLPNAAKGKLVLNGVDVTAGDTIPVANLHLLAFVPVEGGFDGTVDFLWNGYNGTKYAPEDATVTINSSPEVLDIHLVMKKGDPSLTFSGTYDFVPNYIDPGEEALVNVKIVTLPDPTKGKLVLDNGLGVDADVTPNQVINVADLNRLKFIPEPGVSGDVTFDWNGSDGLQYALNDATVTIDINTPPVVSDIRKTGKMHEVIDFTSGNFALAPAYQDVDADNLAQVKIDLPAGFASSGKLSYTSVAGTVYITPSSSVVLSVTELESLQFEPSPSLEKGRVVTFPWYGSDGKHFSNTPANVVIAYDDIPIAGSLFIDMEEGQPSTVIILKGSYLDSVTGVTYGNHTDPLKGLLTQDPSDPNGLTWTYAPNVDFKYGTDGFTYTVKNDEGQLSAPANVSIRIHKSLDGWVGNKLKGDTRVLKETPGQPLKLSAESSAYAQGVTAKVDGVDVVLSLANPLTWETDGYKQWVNTSYILPTTVTTGLTTVVFTALDGAGAVLQTEQASKLADNDFRVVGANLTLIANPDKILGDGKSTTVLTALLVDDDGKPIPGVEVVFTAPPATGSFVGPNYGVTDSDGKATATYKSAEIVGVSEQTISLKATVDDSVLGLRANDTVDITFMPATINGIITSGIHNTPVPNATVRVSLYDGSGIEIFHDEITTDANGAYQFIVPKGNVEYDLEVETSVNIGGVLTPVTYHQKARVDAVSGGPDENFDSEKTLTGLVLFKQPNGQSSMLSSDVLAKTSVYLKKSDGSYVLENGTPKAFPLDSQGVFNANGLDAGDYALEVMYEDSPFKPVLISSSHVSVKANGEMNITEELVDPNGYVTDAVTKLPIEGAKVVLHYANTPRNIGKGLTPGATVTLPIMVFPPNNNASPDQLTDPSGFYAYNVYPETDYYLEVTKPGYRSYTSPILSVEWDIVKHDLELDPISTNSGSYGLGTVGTPNISLDLSVDKNKVKEGEQSQVTVNYKNESTSTLASGEIKVTIPEGAVIVDAAGGIVTGNTIVWKVTNLSGGQSGNYKITVKWPLTDASDKVFDIPGEFKAAGASVITKSSVKVNVYSDRFGDLKHYRYILGYPDKQFKPNGSMTRAELAAIVARLTENVDVEYSLPYKDIRAGHWATNYIKIATKHGYFSVSKDGLFRPDEPITRGELAAVMARFLKLEVGKSTTVHFSDTTGHWAGNIIEALYNGKFLSGYTDGSFKPNNKIIRVEAVTMINRMLYRGPLQGYTQLFPDMPTSHWGFGEVQEATVSHESVRNEDGSETWTKKLSDDMQ
ncbi:S-layer homology domain-containing protein [Cohnella sp. WQ 127256]|uniref:S-layer homology domain-containing protein n=1 Tax=Cohnella sp. WQ 127256 TaxID=2938790 RepID=UPI002119A07D|nr:S-layer homology domain-containing protein [Cohnella sp. WQ 127256]